MCIKVKIGEFSFFYFRKNVHLMIRISLIVLISSFIPAFTFAGQEDALFKQANDAYLANDFSKSIELYEQVVALGFQSFELEYNLANAYFRQKNTGKAVLHYERALLLNPEDEDANYNLSLVISQLEGREQLPDFFLTKWWKNTKMALGADTWAGIAVVLLWIGFGGLGLWQVGKTRDFRKMGFIVGMAALVLSLLPFSLAWSRASFEKSTKLAIVMADNPPLKSAPDQAGSEIFKLQEGEKLQLLDHLGGYWQVRLSNGEKGWVAEDDLEEI